MSMAMVALVNDLVQRVEKIEGSLLNNGEKAEAMLSRAEAIISNLEKTTEDMTVQIEKKIAQATMDMITKGEVRVYDTTKPVPTAPLVMNALVSGQKDLDAMAEVLDAEEA
jgi:replicative DNA helicase